MSIFNMKKTCEKAGISEFSRTRGGWMKLVEGIDKSKKGGYSFVGDNFFKVGNFESNLPSGLYLDQSTSVVDGEKVLTMNLFKIEKGEVELINTTPKSNGWAYRLWDDVDEYFDNGGVSCDDLMSAIDELTTDTNLIDELIEKLTIRQAKEDRPYEFRNWWECLSHLTDANVWSVPVQMWDNLPEDSKIPNTSKRIRCHGVPSHLLKYISKQMNFVSVNEDEYEIDENTPVDFKEGNARIIASESFKRMLKMYETYYLVTTRSNYTGYHNKLQVVIFWYDDGTVYIRSFTYFVDPQKRDHIPADIVGREC